MDLFLLGGVWWVKPAKAMLRWTKGIPQGDILVAAFIVWCNRVTQNFTQHKRPVVLFESAHCNIATMLMFLISLPVVKGSYQNQRGRGVGLVIKHTAQVAMSVTVPFFCFTPLQIAMDQCCTTFLSLTNRAGWRMSRQIFVEGLRE